MTREQVAEKVAWIIAGMAAEYHGRTIEPEQVFPSDTLVMHGIDDNLALIEFSYLAEKALGIAVSDELLDDDATVATLVDRIAGELREHEIQSSRAAEAREWVPSNARLHIVARRERIPAARLLNNLPNVAWMANTKVIDAILASAAAPVFFPPHGLPLTPGGNAFVDGGVFANNPSTAALAALLGSRLTAERSIPLSGVYLLSVGTGFRASSYPPPDALFPYGVLGWLRPRQDNGAPSPCLQCLSPMYSSRGAGPTGGDNLSLYRCSRAAARSPCRPTRTPSQPRR